MTRGLSDDALDHCEEGEWSVRDILAHLLDRRRYQRERIELMLTEQRPSFPDVDEVGSLEESRYRTRPIDWLLDELERGRAEDVERFEGLDEAQLGRDGEHSLIGTVTVGETLHHIVHHDLLHVAQAAETLAAIAHRGRGNMRLLDQ